MKTISVEKVDEILEGFEAPGPWEGDELAEVLDSLPHRKSDAELDAEIDRLTEAVQTIGTPDGPAFEAINELGQATALLSDVLRSSELVDDIDLKRNMLQLAVRGWILVIGTMMAEDVHGQVIRSLMSASMEKPPEGDDAYEILTAIMLIVAVFVTSSMVYSHLGTRHLATTIELTLEDPDFTSSASASSIIVWLQAQLGFPEATKRLTELLQRLPRASFLYNVTMSLTLVEYRTTPDLHRAKGLLEILVASTTSGSGGGPLEARKGDLERQAATKRFEQSRRSYQERIRQGLGEMAAIDEITEAGAALGD